VIYEELSLPMGNLSYTESPTEPYKPRCAYPKSAQERIEESIRVYFNRQREA